MCEKSIADIVRVLPLKARNVLKDNTSFERAVNNEAVSEIRMRVNCPLMVVLRNKELILPECVLEADDIRESLQYISDYSLYAYEDDISKGFITLKNGHRAGLLGQAVSKNGQVVTQKYISFINIRVAHQIKGCADKIMSFLTEGGFSNTLIISPPGCGKTTLLRDVVRQLSYGFNNISYKVGVVDERSEIAACYQGVPQNDVGIRTDVADHIDKYSGMMMLLRSMSPDIIAVDELSEERDMKAVKHLFGCGCGVLATVHGTDFEAVKDKLTGAGLIGTTGFERVVVLGNKPEMGAVVRMQEV